MLQVLSSIHLLDMECRESFAVPEAFKMEVKTIFRSW